MNEYKKRADKEKKEIADADREFLENTLYPIADKNRREKPPRKYWRCAAIITPMCLIVILSVVISLHYFRPATEDFEDSLVSGQADISKLNEALEYTQLTGDFGYVTMSYWAKKGTPVTFMATKETEDPDKRYVSVTIDVIVDTAYDYKFLNMNNTSIKYLGYTVEYNLRSEIFADEELTVYKYDFSAYMDTGKERYIIQYLEMSIYEGLNIEAFLQETIIRKQ